MIKFVLILSAFATTPKTAFFENLVIPGLWHIQNKSARGYAYLSADVAGALAYFYTSRYASSVRNSYITFLHAHATGNYVTDESIVDLLEKYYSSDEYLENLYREARQIYPDNPGEQDKYVSENKLTTLKWAWDSKSDFYKYQDERKHYRQVLNNRLTILGIILTNHLSSAVDGFITAKLLKKKNMELHSTFAPGYWKTTVSVRF